MRQVTCKACTMQSKRTHDESNPQLQYKPEILGRDSSSCGCVMRHAPLQIMITISDISTLTSQHAAGIMGRGTASPACAAQLGTPLEHVSTGLHVLFPAGLSCFFLVRSSSGCRFSTDVLSAKNCRGCFCPSEALLCKSTGCFSTSSVPSPA